MSEAMDELYRLTHGVPRLINLLCDRCLLACYIVKTKCVDREVVQKSFEEVSGGALLVS